MTNLKPAPDRALAVTLAVTVAVRAAGLPTAAAGRFGPQGGRKLSLDNVP